LGVTNRDSVIHGPDLIGQQGSLIGRDTHPGSTFYVAEDRTGI
jgi:hypothetical protein